MHFILAFILTAAVIELTPGPNMTYLALLRVTHGQAAALSAVAGVATGLLILGLLAAAGLGAIMAASPLLYTVLRWAGTAYLFWLAWDAWRDSAQQAYAPHARDHRFVYFRRGVITNLLNPKAAIFYITILPQFMPPDHGAAGLPALLSLIYVAIATLAHLGVVFIAGLYMPNPAQSLWIRRSFALALGGIALWFLFGSAPE